jgi:glutamyl-tRNA synthetase
MRKIRTRVAPSPTGDPHVGTAYMALFNYCFAKQHNGEFILRIEDTDQARSTRESETKIFDSLKWLGLNWVEGPDIGGPHVPYRQSERKDIYHKYAHDLVSYGHAFHCFCTSDKIAADRATAEANGHAYKYDCCNHLKADEVAEKLSQNVPYTIRMHLPETDGDCVIDDLLRGQVSIPWSQMDRQVLLKQDGMPTYFLANVVDDHLMDITHVIRGEEWLPSTPKLILLYHYFGWEKPVFCHMPLLRDKNGGKLSKRHNPTSITFYRDKGYKPEALLNYLGRMGWSMPNQEEKFTLDEMIKNFDLARVSLGGPVFDVDKLTWLNGVWIRDSSDEDFSKGFVDWLSSNDKLLKLIPMIKPRVDTYDKVLPIVEFIYNSDIALNVSDFDQFKDFSPLKMVESILSSFDNMRVWDKDNILTTLKSVATNEGVKFKQIMPLVFLVITGSLNSFSVIDSMEMIGIDLTRYRFRKALNILKVN